VLFVAGCRDKRRQFNADCGRGVVGDESGAMRREARLVMTTHVEDVDVQLLPL